MYLIVAYDCAEDRTRVPREFLRRYLTHIQNSVFEGEISEGQYKEIRSKLKEHHEDGESILFISIQRNMFEREVLGEDPTKNSKFI